MKLLDKFLKHLNVKLTEKKDLIIGFKNLKTNNIKYGIEYSQNGDYYIGEFLNNKKNGNGISILKNGTIYEGTFKNNKYNGKLIQLEKFLLVNGKKEKGNGISYHNNKDKYIDNYKNNLKIENYFF